jgi:hypothetical protein
VPVNIAAHHVIQSPRLVLLDSVSEVRSEHGGALVITGSHGGVSAAKYALAVGTWLYVFNDAGVGKDGAGIAALRLLEDAGAAAAVVAHSSARIGDARDAWEHGVLSAVNRFAAQLGLEPGQRLSAQITPDAG